MAVISLFDILVGLADPTKLVSVALHIGPLEPCQDSALGGMVYIVHAGC